LTTALGKILGLLDTDIMVWCRNTVCFYVWYNEFCKWVVSW